MRDKRRCIGNLRQGTWVWKCSRCRQYSTTFTWGHSFLNGEEGTQFHLHLSVYYAAITHPLVQRKL